MSEPTRKVTVRRYGWTTARIDYEPIEIEVPADLPEDEVEEYASDVPEERWVETGSETFEHKNLDFEFEIDDPDAPSSEP